MKTFIHIGLGYCGAEQMQGVLDDKRDHLAKKNVLYAQTPGRKNHTKLWLSMTDPRHVDPLRFHRGHGSADAQRNLRDKLLDGLQNEIKKVEPETMILSCHQLGGGLILTSEIERLRDFVAQMSDEIEIVMHLDEQARVLARHYAEQVMSGRYASLDQELKFDAKDWHDEALKTWGPAEPMTNQFPEVQAIPFWLDYGALIARWQKVFGAKSVRVRPYDETVFSSKKISDEIAASFDLGKNFGNPKGISFDDQPSGETLARARAVNRIILQHMEKGQVIPRQLHHRITKSVIKGGDPIDPSGLSTISKRFAKGNAVLTKEFPALGKNTLKADKPSKNWVEPDVSKGFNPSKVVGGFQGKIDKLTKEVRDVARAQVENKAKGINGDDHMSEIGKRMLPNKAKKEVPKLAAGRFAPHNKIGNVDEVAQLPQYTPIKPRKLQGKSTGNVIVACMKNEGPYILEWIAYHRAIGVDGFIVYTNGCEDGTSEILDRLDEMGVIVHQNNDEWKGNSPQQAALNRAIKHPLVLNAEWVAHIDVDEFINVRLGNGTLPEFIDQVGDATNVAMTWRLFGHNGVERLADELVIDQFDHAAPKFCPKPHTVWGFKTMYKNINAYEKISCHRTTKLREHRRDDVHWVNGDLKPIGGSIADNGWRSSLKSVGYDKIQLNHYALRSAESYLIKRQRGRALHVDRSIGINYWLRMDFNSYQDLTIKRNSDRTQAEVDSLKTDDVVRKWHEKSLQWHKAKAIELHGMPEFEDLFQQAIQLKLNDVERVAWCLANDLES